MVEIAPPVGYATSGALRLREGAEIAGWPAGGTGSGVKVDPVGRERQGRYCDTAGAGTEGAPRSDTTVGRRGRPARGRQGPWTRAARSTPALAAAAASAWRRTW